MKFVYVDESEDGRNGPCLAFFRLHVDAYRLKKVMRDVRTLFVDIEDVYPERLRELKSSRLTNGVRAWRRVDADHRKALFARLCAFVNGSGCHGLSYVLDCRIYGDRRTAGDGPPWASIL